ncbi:MAG TPA: hypothetical protein VLE96_04875 [Chlamydiales bacterium]|nr:hypothetical protein [Chlamydiales bacterium]
MQSINFNIGFIDWITNAVKKPAKEKVNKVAQNAIAKNIPAPAQMPAAVEVLPPVVPAPVEIPMPIVVIADPIVETPSIMVPDPIVEISKPLSERAVEVIGPTSTLIPLSFSQRILAKLTLGNLAYALIVAAAVACVAYFIYNWKYSEKPVEIEPEEIKTPEICEEIKVAEPIEDEKPTYSYAMDILKYAGGALACVFAVAFFNRNTSAPANMSHPKSSVSSDLAGRTAAALGRVSCATDIFDCSSTPARASQGSISLSPSNPELAEPSPAPRNPKSQGEKSTNLIDFISPSLRIDEIRYQAFGEEAKEFQSIQNQFRTGQEIIGRSEIDQKQEEDRQLLLRQAHEDKKAIVHRDFERSVILGSSVDGKKEIESEETQEFQSIKNQFRTGQAMIGLSEAENSGRALIFKDFLAEAAKKVKVHHFLDFEAQARRDLEQRMNVEREHLIRVPQIERKQMAGAVLAHKQFGLMGEQLLKQGNIDQEQQGRRQSILNRFQEEKAVIEFNEAENRARDLIVQDYLAENVWEGQRDHFYSESRRRQVPLTSLGNNLPTSASPPRKSDEQLTPHIGTATTFGASTRGSSPQPRHLEGFTSLGQVSGFVVIPQGSPSPSRPTNGVDQAFQYLGDQPKTPSRNPEERDSSI